MTGKNIQKQDAYRVECGRLKKALEYGFYLEAVSIEYALIEDRLNALLYYSGIVSRKEKLMITKFTKPYVKYVLNVDDSTRITITQIGVKIDLIRCLLMINEKNAAKIDESVESKRKPGSKRRKEYLQTIVHRMDRLDKDVVLELLEQIEDWKNKRNVLIHALLNRHSEASDDAKRECAKEGELLFRALDDKLVKPFKRGADIRMQYKIQ